MQDYFSLSMTTRDVNQISALGLAHCGDAVFELMVRSWLCLTGRARVENLHRATVSYVCAPAQAARVDRMLPLLSEAELAYYRRGRNAHVRQIPKNATHEPVCQGHGPRVPVRRALSDRQTARINELFEQTMEEPHAL